MVFLMFLLLFRHFCCCLWLSKASFHKFLHKFIQAQQAVSTVNTTTLVVNLHVVSINTRMPNYERHGFAYVCAYFHRCRVVGENGYANRIVVPRGNFLI